MTLRFYIQSVAKRAKGVALIDSGATKNFMNLDYARWLKLPIKELKQHCPLFNVDGTENKSGALCYYMDLQFRTGTQTMNRGSISQIWETTKQSSDIPGSQPSNPEWTGKEGGSTCHNSQSSYRPQMQQKPCTPPGQRISLDPSEKCQINISLEGSPLDPQPMNQTPQYLKNTRGTAKYSVKPSPRDCPSQPYGIMQSNYYLEHQTPFQEGYSHLPRKKRLKCTNSYKNTSKEGQSKSPYAANFFFVKKKDGKL